MIPVFLGVILDLIIGDPYKMPHPIRLMGRIIEKEEVLVRKYITKNKHLRIAGLFMVFSNIILGFCPLYFLLKIMGGFWRIVVSSIIIFYSLSARTLAVEARKVKESLEVDLESGRKRLSYIVGRNPAYLDEEGVIRATVETVAENTSDGVIAPLFFATILGAPGALMYKFVNTMDSMLGYKNEEYIDLGRWPAIIDDLYNFIPARITAFLMALTSIKPCEIKNNFIVIRRYHNKHISPNAGYPESAVAAILGVTLGGNQYYGDILVEKPSIGLGKRKIKLDDIDLTNKVLFKSELLYLFFYLIYSWGIVYIL